MWLVRSKPIRYKCYNSNNTFFTYFFAQMTSCFVHYDIIFYPFPVNSQYLKKSGINSPALDSVFHPEEVVSQPKLKQALSLEENWASMWLLKIIFCALFSVESNWLVFHWTLVKSRKIHCQFNNCSGKNFLLAYLGNYSLFAQCMHCRLLNIMKICYNRQLELKH